MPCSVYQNWSQFAGKISSWERDGSGRLTIPVSKSDQEGQGAILYLGAVTVTRLQVWGKLQGNVGEFVFTGIRRGGSSPVDAFDPPVGSPNSDCSRQSCYLPELFPEDDSGGEDMGPSVSAHSFRIGSAQSLARRGATLPQLQTAGRWKSPLMPAAYCRNEAAGNGAIARLPL